MDVEEENDRLERELASPSRVRMTEYALVRASVDLALRRIERIAERLHLGVAELAGDYATLPTVQSRPAIALVIWERSARKSFGLDLQVDGLAPVEFAQNSGQICEAWIAARPEHTHQILRVD